MMLGRDSPGLQGREAHTRLSPDFKENYMLFGRNGITLPQIGFKNQNEERPSYATMKGLAETEAGQMIAGLNKTLVFGLAAGAAVWYFFLRKS